MTTINNATQLQDMDLNLAGNYELGGNIDCSGIGNFEPVGGWNATPDFTGTFDGKNFKISNLTVNRAADNYIGLFGECDSATIQNVTLEDFTLTGKNEIGALIGYCEDTSVSNITITNVDITGEDDVGGMVGMAYAASANTISNCNSTGVITCAAGDSIGGLIGAHYLYATSNCHSSVIVSGVHRVGGFVGYWYSGTFDKCYATGTVDGYDYVGGFVGHGRNLNEETISRCYSSGVVTGTDDYVGGFAGWINGTTNDCYALGTAEGVDYVAGFAGVGEYVNRCYSIGSITHGVGETHVGGFLGARAGSGETVACFWDKTTSGENTGVGGGEAQTGVTGHLTATMKSISTFSGWDISSIWSITAGCSSGYPCLISVAPCCPPSALPPLDPTVAPKKPSLERIRNIEMMNLGRAFIDKDGNFNYETRFHR